MFIGLAYRFSWLKSIFKYIDYHYDVIAYSMINSFFVNYNRCTNENKWHYVSYEQQSVMTILERYYCSHLRLSIFFLLSIRHGILPPCLSIYRRNQLLDIYAEAFLHSVNKQLGARIFHRDKTVCIL
jgi:hypothetical protein